MAVLTLVLGGVACGTRPPDVSGTDVDSTHRAPAATGSARSEGGEPVPTETSTTETSTTATPSAFAGIWPFASEAEIRAYDRQGTMFRDPELTAREFASRYLGMDNPVVFGFEPSGPGRGEVNVGFRYAEGHRPLPDPRPTFTVQVAQLGSEGTDGPWTVVAAGSPTLRIDAPAPLDVIASPVQLSGKLATFESNAAVQVREDGMMAGQFLGSGHMTGTAGSVSFRTATKAAGAVVVLDVSSADGQGVLSATVVRVRFPDAPVTPTPSAPACNDRTSGGGVSGFATLTGVRVGTHDGYDRITFEFAGGIPSYQIKAARLPLRLDPSDLPLALDGRVFSDVVFRGASAAYAFDASGQQVPVSYTGPGRLSPHFPVLREAAERGDFEGVLAWTLGQSASTCLRVLELQSPPRLAIDLAHPGS